MKIAFIVQSDWMTAHFGVRNLFVSCFKLLEEKGHDVQFVSFEYKDGRLFYYRNIINNAELFSSISKSTIGTKKRYRSLTKKNKKNKIKLNMQFLGESIKNDYDAFFITNPWLIEYPIDLGNKPRVLICYDCVANTLTLLNQINKPYWGAAHNIGYQYAKRNSYYFLSISEKTDREIKEYYNPLNHSYLPPVLTYAFFDVNYNPEQKKENAIVLAAPFDKRKGLEIMPEYLNRLSSNFDTLYIYGTPRCGRKLYNKFYKNLKVKNVIHYNKITSDDLIKLYKKCKFLFFPSIEEGLGMPIMEAQLCGCRVVTTNAAPMNQLVCSGNYLLTDNIDKDVNKMSEMLQDHTFDYHKLSINAKKKFSTENVYNKLVSVVTGN